MAARLPKHRTRWCIEPIQREMGTCVSIGQAHVMLLSSKLTSLRHQQRTGIMNQSNQDPPWVPEMTGTIAGISAPDSMGDQTITLEYSNGATDNIDSSYFYEGYRAGIMTNLQTAYERGDTVTFWSKTYGTDADGVTRKDWTFTNTPRQQSHQQAPTSSNRAR